MGFFRNVKIARIMNRAGAYVRTLNNADFPTAQAGREDLFDLILTDKSLRPILTEHRADRTLLNDTYGLLLEHGAGQWLGTIYLPVAVMLAPGILDFLLTETRNTQVDPSDYQTHRWGMTASALINFHLSNDERSISYLRHKAPLKLAQPAP